MAPSSSAPARVLAIADVVVAGADGRPLLANHGRRDADRLAPGAAGVEVLADLTRAGRLVAMVGGRADQTMVEALRDLGVTVEVLSPAPTS